MKENWLQTKLVNARTNEGKPQTERLEYARELFESFGMQDPRFSSANLVGSTIKGYGLEEGSDLGEESDIDAILLYYEIPTTLEQKYAFLEDFSKFQEEFKLKKKKEGKENFKIDTNPGILNLRYHLEINSSGEISIDELRPEMFIQLSFPIIKSKNPNALMPMEKVLDAIKKTVAKLDDKQKRKLLNAIRVASMGSSMGNFKKYSPRVDSTVTENEYIDSRWKMLQPRLKSKFGLSIEN